MSRIQVSFSKLGAYALRLKRILIDGDIFTYSIGFAVEADYEWPDGTVDKVGDLNLAKRLLDNRVRYFTNSIPPNIEFRLVITGDARNWRKDLDDTYKGTRGRKPIDYKGIRAYMRALECCIETSDGLEADDLMAAHASSDRQVALLSFDKDFFTVPGTFIHASQKERARLYETTINGAICFLFFQALVGDSVDAYKGVPNVGESKAMKMLYLCELKGLTIRQAYLLLKKTVRARSAKFSDPVAKQAVTKLGKTPVDFWHEFRKCLDLAALTWHGEEASVGIGLRRVFKYRNEAFEYYVPYYDDECTHKNTKVRL